MQWKPYKMATRHHGHFGHYMRTTVLQLYVVSQNSFFIYGLRQLQQKRNLKEPVIIYGIYCSYTVDAAKMIQFVCCCRTVLFLDRKQAVALSVACSEKLSLVPQKKVDQGFYKSFCLG